MLAMTGKNHPHARKKKQGVDDSVDDRETPNDVFLPLHEEFHFTLDVCASRHNAKCARYYSLGPGGTLYNPRQLSIFSDEWVGDPEALGYDGLTQPWRRNEVVWCNPPFSNIEPWVERATFVPATVVMLLPANRTEQPWWQKWIEPYRDEKRMYEFGPETRFLGGRRNFRSRGQAIGNRTSRNPPFGVVIVIWDRRDIDAPIHADHRAAA